MKLLITLWISLAVSCSGQVYDTNGAYVQTFAGSGFAGYVDGLGQQTMFNRPAGIVADGCGNVFVLDQSNKKIRKITANAEVTTFADLSQVGEGVYSLYSVIGISKSGEMWTATTSGSAVRISPTGIVDEFTFTNISYPTGFCFDSHTNLYISDYLGQRIWKKSFGEGALSVYAGSGNFGTIDGRGIFCAFYNPESLACDLADNIYVWDSGSGAIRKIDTFQNVSTITATGHLNVDGNAPSISPVFSMCFDSDGNLILAGGDFIRKLSIVTNSVTLAGDFAQDGYIDGPGITSRFSGAYGVCASKGKIFISEIYNQRIRSITNNPQPQTVSPANLSLGTYAGLQITGSVGRAYQIQSSANLTNWTTRDTLVLNETPHLWIDQNPIAGNKFYRALLLP